MSENNHLLKISDVLPSQFHGMFKHKTFNHMQSLLFPQAFETNLNMVVAAPTGCGKTVIHEIAIMRLLVKLPIKSIKVVYIAPNKALCQQKLDEWVKKFTPFGLSVMEVTGDIDLKYCLRLIAKASIVITTPEKWDSLTRSWKDHIFLLGAIDLLLLDEVHHLGDDRGSSLEIVVVRMRVLNQTCIARIKEHSEVEQRESMRVIALSATLPNLADIGDWIGCEPHSVHYFDDTFRPVPLTIHTLALGNMNNPFLFERSLDDKVGDIVTRFSEGKQTLIFCSSKKGAETLAALLARKQGARFSAAVGQSGRDIADWTHTMQDGQLRELIRSGYAYHHGGLPPDDRAMVERLYLSGHIHVLCSTSTLAHGVNLPAHLVIIKGTNCWRGGSRGYEKMCRSEIIQMLGRAGRPGFDNSGVAVVMTSNQDRDHYAAMSLSAEVVESTLQGILVEAICSEITQHVVQNLAECLTWIKSTFFYIRVRKNPKRYGFSEALNQGDPAQYFDRMLVDICTAAIKQLSSAGIVELGEDAALLPVQPRPEAHIMTRHLIKFDTMHMLIQLPPALTLAQLLRDFSKSKELCKPLRKTEKRMLNDFMKMVRFPLKDRVQDPWHKSYVLMQAAVARLDLKDFSLRVEQSEIVECGLRVLSALAELCKARNSGPLLENTILLDRALRCRMWEYNYGSVFAQCPGLSDATRNGLVLRGVRSVGDLEGCSLTRLQDIAQCSAMEAREIMHFAQLLRVSRLSLRTRVDAEGQLVIDVDPPTRTSVTPQEALIPVDQLPSYQLLCYDTRSSEVLCYRKLGSASVGQHTNFSVPLSREGRSDGLEHVRCCLLGTLVGNDCVQGSNVNILNAEQVQQSTKPVAVSKTHTAASSGAKRDSIGTNKAPAGRLPRIANISPSSSTLGHSSASQPLPFSQSPVVSKMAGSASRTVPSFETSLRRFALGQNESDNQPGRASEEGGDGNGRHLGRPTEEPQARGRAVQKSPTLGPANNSAPGVSRELSVLRSKAAEMNFDGQQAAKRRRPFQHQSSQAYCEESPLSEVVSCAIVTPTPFKTDSRIAPAPFFDRDDRRVPFFDRDEAFGGDQFVASEQQAPRPQAVERFRPPEKSFGSIPFESNSQAKNSTHGRVSPPAEQVTAKRRPVVNNWIIPQAMSAKSQGPAKSAVVASSQPRQEQQTNRSSSLQEDLFDMGFF